MYIVHAVDGILGTIQIHFAGQPHTPTVLAAGPLINVLLAPAALRVKPVCVRRLMCYACWNAVCLLSTPASCYNNNPALPRI